MKNKLSNFSVFFIAMVLLLASLNVNAFIEVNVPKGQQPVIVTPNNNYHPAEE